MRSAHFVVGVLGLLGLLGACIHPESDPACEAACIKSLSCKDPTRDPTGLCDDPDSCEMTYGSCIDCINKTACVPYDCPDGGDTSQCPHHIPCVCYGP